MVPKMGNFSVKSAYKLAVQSQFSELASCSSGPFFVWKAFWNLHIPAKIKAFCWRACKQILPTMAFLQHRQIVDNGLCPLCLEAIESVDHALWSCKVAASFWGSCPLRKAKFFCKLACVHFLDRLAYVFSVVEANFVAQFIVTAWYIWAHRNAVVLGSKPNSFDDFWLKAGRFLLELELAGSGSPLHRTPGHTLSWSPPPLGVFKLNTDAALFKSKKKVGVGIVIRDHSGVVKLAAAQVFFHCTDVEQAEARAVLKGIQLAIQHSCLPLRVEMDALRVVRLCNGSEISRLDVGNVIHDIQQLMSVHQVAPILFTFRECNQVAHSIANWALGFNSSTTWLHRFPDWLLQLAGQDVSSVSIPGDGCFC